MADTVVVNVKHEPCDVYIGRAAGTWPASIWGNPFVVGRDGSREEVVRRYEEYVRDTPALMERIGELEGKRLGCWCKLPNHDVPCHGDALLRILDERKPRYPLEVMLPIAERLVEQLQPYTERARIVGSIRREKATVKDIEILAIPKTATVSRDLFGREVATQDVLGEYIDSGIATGMFAPRLDKLGRPAVGARFKRLLYRTPEGLVPLDLFVADEERWGHAELIRTGPAEFSQASVTRRSFGGLLPDHLEVRGHRIWNHGEALATPYEADVLAILGLPWIAPAERRWPL